jgi:hypothetical protein
MGFPKNSQFHDDERNPRGAKRHLDFEPLGPLPHSALERTGIQPPPTREKAATNDAVVPQDRLEHWYSVISLALDRIEGKRYAEAESDSELEVVRDEVYSYLKG